MRLLTPLIARYVAREMQRKHPGMTPQQIRDSMVHEVGELPSDEQSRFIDAVIERVPQQAEVEKPVSAWVLVAANLVPLAGVLLWGWDAFALIALFWMENVIIGVFFAAAHAVRWIRATRRCGRRSSSWCRSSASTTACSPRSTACSCSACWAASATTSTASSCSSRRRAPPPTSACGCRSRRCSRATASRSCWNYLYRGEFRRAQLSRLMTEPYERVIVLHLTIILGGIAAMALGSPLWALLVLLALKIGA